MSKLLGRFGKEPLHRWKIQMNFTRWKISVRQGEQPPNGNAMHSFGSLEHSWTVSAGGGIGENKSINNLLQQHASQVVKTSL